MNADHFAPQAKPRMDPFHGQSGLEQQDYQGALEALEQTEASSTLSEKEQAKVIRSK